MRKTKVSHPGLGAWLAPEHGYIMKPAKLLAGHEASFLITEAESKETKLVLLKGQLGPEAEIPSFDGWSEEDKQHGKC